MKARQNEKPADAVVVQQLKSEEEGIYHRSLSLLDKGIASLAEHRVYIGVAFYNIRNFRLYRKHGHRTMQEYLIDQNIPVRSARRYMEVAAKVAYACGVGEGEELTKAHADKYVSAGLELMQLSEHKGPKALAAKIEEEREAAAPVDQTDADADVDLNSIDLVPDVECENIRDRIRRARLAKHGVARVDPAKAKKESRRSALQFSIDQTRTVASELHKLLVVNNGKGRSEQAALELNYNIGLALFYLNAKPDPILKEAIQHSIPKFADVIHLVEEWDMDAEAMEAYRSERPDVVFALTQHLALR